MSQLVKLKTFLRNQPHWVNFRTAGREGWWNVFQRHRIQGKILQTKPVITDQAGDKEVRVLSWHRDYLNLIWALKSFYYFSEQKFPLYIHDGGLKPENIKTLKKHFPTAEILLKSEMDSRVEDYLVSRSLNRSAIYRKENPAMRKVFDFFIFSKAEEIISIDSDIVFFKKPEVLISGKFRTNLYNKDLQFAYSLSVSELEKRFGVCPPERVNSGLFRLQKDIFDYLLIEDWLKDEGLFENKWVTEQTIHALAATKKGMEFLPETYMVSTERGFVPGAICKHYPGFFRPFLYQEGMRRVWAENPELFGGLGE